jgi:transposase
MECKYCQGTNCRKNGYTGGFQRYNCKDCNRNWTLGKGRAYSAEKRFEALKRYLEGLGFRSTGRILGVSNVTVLKWIRSMGEKLFETGALWRHTDLKSVAQIQLDEFWHYVKKNEISYGYGLLYAEKQNKYLPFFVVNELKKQPEASGL